MAEAFLMLSQDDQREVLEIVREKTQRPTLLLEKDVWVVWALGALFDSALADDLTFKGGTSLSKAYKVIDRFSEDIDLTYDIRKLIPDLIGGDGFLPSSRSQASKCGSACPSGSPRRCAPSSKPRSRETNCTHGWKWVARTTTNCCCTTPRSSPAAAMFERS